MCDKHQFFFEFDRAFTHQLIEKFEASPAHPLTEDVAPAEKGVYALYRRRRQTVNAPKAARRSFPGNTPQQVIPAQAGIQW